MNEMYVESAVARLAKRGEELCGDTVRTSHTADSVTAVLSDGLGSGVKANILATLTTSIAANMFETGASLEETMETIGRTLPVCREREIAYSTLCAIEVNRDGQAFVIEFDNPPVLLLRGGDELVDLERTKRQIGEDDKQVSEAHFWVQRGDYLIAVSDGVIHAGIGAKLSLGLGTEGLIDYLEDNLQPGQSAQEVADGIVQYCQQLYEGEPGDDTTALVLRIRLPRRSIFAVGPPRDASMDKEVAKRVANFSGFRVICGGTTSKMVARELGRELKIDLENVDPQEPPSGEIDGIDMVTEGIMTLTEVMQILEKDELCSEDATAEQIAARMLKSDYLEFLVGRAINPAHQNPDLPFDLTLKQQIVTRIAQQLRNRGKKVRINYY